MKKKLLSVVLVLSVLGTMLVGCSSSTSSEETTTTTTEASDDVAEETTASEDWTIGCTVYYMSEFITLMTEGMEARADELGTDIVILNAENDAANQITQVENLIAQQVDVIIIAAVDSDAIVPAIEMCEEAGIPLVGVNMLFNTDEDYYYVGPDDVLAGELEMQNAIDAIGGSGNIVILEGPIGQSAQIQRLEGNENILANYEDEITVLAQQTANWSREEALAIMENWLEAYSGEIDAVVAHNDEMALGAIQAIEAAGLTGEIVVTAVDAIEDGCNAVVEGTLLGTVYQDAVVEGADSVTLAYNVLTGEVTEKELTYIDMTWIDSSNAEDLLVDVYGY